MSITHQANKLPQIIKPLPPSPITISRDIAELNESKIKNTFRNASSLKVDVKYRGKENSNAIQYPLKKFINVILPATLNKCHNLQELEIICDRLRPMMKILKRFNKKLSMITICSM